MAHDTTKTVLVTGVGGNVGQGVVRNLRHFCPELRIIGTDISAVTACHYFLDDFFQVPYCYSPDFPQKFIHICKTNRISLVIPTTDYENYYLGLMTDQLPPTICSPPDICKIFLDKFLTYKEFSKVGIPFAESFLPSDYQDNYEKIIVKPREGRGSRDIYIQPSDPQAFDDRFIVQEFLSGMEITTAFYVRKDGCVHGMITFSRGLVSGMTERCEVVKNFDADLSSIIKKLASHFKINGPCNIQSIKTDDGRLVPFEINCRYSGTNSIRSHLGFPDVLYGVQEYLYNKIPDTSNIKNGSAIRYFSDIIYLENDLSSIKPGNDGSIIF